MKSRRAITCGCSNCRGIWALVRAEQSAEMARALILFFLDADVAIAPAGLARAEASMSGTHAGRVIGSYDDDPAARSAIQPVQDLAHHTFISDRVPTPRPSGGMRRGPARIYFRGRRL